MAELKASQDAEGIFTSNIKVNIDEEMVQIKFRRESEDDIDISKTQVGVDHQNLFILTRQSDRDVGNNSRLSNPSFATGYRNDPR